MKITQNIPKTTLEPYYSGSVQKKGSKKDKIPKMTSFRKVAKLAIFAKAIAFAIWSVWEQN